MNGNTAVAVRGSARLGAMVSSDRSIYIYWCGAAVRAVRLVDLSGRPSPELLDGCGERILEPRAGQSHVYADDLLPGHLYVVEVGDLEHGRFLPLVGTAPVQTPWSGTRDTSGFPAPYHRS